MGKFVKPILMAMIFSVMLLTCKHIDTLAQAAANSDIIDHDMANMISLSAMAFSSAAEKATPEDEYYIGRAVAANILSNYKIWDGDPYLTAYLNLICGAIVVNSPQPHIYDGYHVVILDSNEINAFTTSGGHIFLTRGIINVAKTEDALAAVIAHEVAHNQLRHSIKSIKSSRVTKALLLTAATGAGIMGMDTTETMEVLNESVSEIIHTMVNSGYSKEQEYDADIAAMAFLAAAGYQPSGLVDMLKELKIASSVSIGGLNKTHPSPGQRIYFAEKEFGRYSVPDNSLNRQDRFNKILGINN